MNPIDAIGKPLPMTREAPPKPQIALNEKEKRVLNLIEGATEVEWEDWVWQMRYRIRTKEQLAKFVELTEEEIKGIAGCGEKLTMSIPPYFVALIDPKNPKCHIRLQCIPQGHELKTARDEMEDPCAEDSHSPVHGLVHRYPDRVLFLVNEMCSMYCRYCTRSRMVGDGKRTLSPETYEAAFDYIRKHKEVRDVLISGGDPLTMSDRSLEYIVKSLKKISHVEFVRIGTRVPPPMLAFKTRDSWPLSLIISCNKYG